MKSGFSKVRVLLIALVVMFAATSAFAETLMMPKRDAKAGTPLVVWGASTLSGNYSIDFGDGSAVFHSSVTGGFGNQNYYLATTHNYTVGGNYTATLTIGAETATVAIQVFDPATTTADNLRSLGVNMAIQDGLRSLYINQTSQDLTSVSTNWGNSYPYADASFIVLAFENHGYTLPNSAAAPTGIYQKYIVRRGLNYVLSQLSTVGLSVQTAGNPCVGSGTGWAGSDCVGFAPPGDQGYSTAIAILPFAASGALSRVNTEVGGVTASKTYGEVLQRLVNAEAFGQTDGVGSTVRGGFGYNFNGGQFDGSTAGWAILCFLDAEAAGATVPAFVKTEFKFGFNNALNTDGTFDYSGDGNPASDNNVGPQKNGIGLQGLYFIGETTGTRVAAVKAAVSSWWNGSTGTGGNAWGGCPTGNMGCAYTMFNNFKGLKLHGITTLPGVTRAAGPGTQPAGDWYADYQDYLVANQVSPNTTNNGNWTLGFSCCYSGNNLVSAIAELILSPVALVLPDEQKFSTVGLSPATHTALEGTAHTVTAKAESTGGTPVPGATVNFKILTGPNAGLTGTATTDSSGLATFTYTDPVGHTGTDTIQATIGNLTSNSVTATWTPLNAPPDAVNDAASTNSGAAVSISVLSNDTDPDHDVLTVTSATQGANGSTVVNGNGTITYTPNNGFAGTDTFTYAISDGKGGTDSASVTVTVTKIAVVATATGGTFVYNGAAETGSCSFVGADSAALTGTLTYSGGAAPINVSSTSVACAFDGTGTNYSSANASAAINITPAATTTVVTCTDAVYTGAAQTTCAANVTGAGGLNQSLAVSYSNNTNVGTATGSASYAGDANHAASTGSATFQITPAATTTVVTCTDAVYTGAAQTTCAANVTGAGGLNQSLTVSYSNNTNVGTATGSASYAGDANHTASNASATFQITPAATTTVVTCTDAVYTGAPQQTCAANVTGAGGLNQSLTVSYSNNTNVGTASGSASYAGDANHTASNASATFQITPAATTTVVTCTDAVYTGAAQTTCAANVTGAGGLNQSLTVSYSNNTNVGTASGSASYAGDANHTASNASATFQITPAATTTVVTCTDAVYTGAAQTTCVANVTGAGGLNQSLTVSYSNNTNVGTATGAASYAGDANHAASTGSATFQITPAATTTVVTCTDAVYTGAAQTTCVANVTGAGGLTQSLPVSYSNNTNVGTATGSASYAGDANHAASTGSATFQITPAATTTVVTCTDAVYTGAAQTTCVANVTGAGGLTQSLPVTYSNNTNVGTATGAASYAGDANHTASNASATFQITPAASTTVISCPASLVYTGAALTSCTAHVTGTGGLDQDVAVTYTANTNVGTAGASATFAGDANHTTSTASTTFAITKAPSVTVVTCPVSVIYTGATQTVCAANVTGAALNQGVTPVTYTANTNVGTAGASATFAGDDNHTGSTGTGSFAITKKSATVTADTKTKVYGTADPVIGATSTGFVATDNIVVSYTGRAAGTTIGNYATHATATGTALANYTVTSVDGSLAITPAALTVTVASKTKPYLSANPALTGTVTGVVAGDAITASYSTTAVTASLPGVYPITAAVADPGHKLGNYAVVNTPGTLTITDLAPVCTAAVASPNLLWPPNHKMVPIKILNVTDPDGNPVTLTVTSIFQDEPTNDSGDGNTSIDGAGVGTSNPSVRAERSGDDDNSHYAGDGCDHERGRNGHHAGDGCDHEKSSNGRVYHIRFTATDGVLSCNGDVTVGVPHDQGHGAAVDDGPVYDSTKAGPLANDDSYTARQLVTLSVAAADGVLDNDSSSAVSAVLVTNPAHGTVVLNASGALVYTSAAGFLGYDTFTYRAVAANGALSAPATVTIKVKANTPPTADNDAYNLKKGGTLVTSAPGVLIGDVDAEGDPLTAVLVAGPASGTFTFNANGSFTFKPASTFTGSVTFTYKVKDATGLYSNVATVTINVLAHWDGDGCDHDRGRNGHRSGDGCDHDKQQHGKPTGHHDGDDCDHDNHRNGHHQGDGCDHDRGR